MPQRSRLLLVFARLLIVFLLISAAALHAAPVLLISIDGLKPEYVTHASEHGLQLPTLQRFLTQGTYADGVVPVLPTVTYPDHTTLITGVWPKEHGIYNNQLFDPDRKLGAAWYWYAESIRVPTLWDAAPPRWNWYRERELAGQRECHQRRHPHSRVLANLHSGGER
jgi:predicted AlkP superfamily pyrophosphatase or phosphodiesterase